MARQEFIHWTTADPHARAGARILEKPFQDVLNRLVSQYAPSNPTAEQKAKIRTEVYKKCAACHDEAGMAEQKRRKDAGEELKLDDFEAPQLAHGIDCESCHGGSERWLSVHYQAWVPKALLLEMGMVDTDDLVGRAQQCTSCHVGGPGKDMNHDMIAAGHPPLRFELSAYHAVIQRKHWDDRKVRQQNPDYDIHLWQAGQWATAKATAELLAERANKAQAKPAGDTGPFTFPAPWPEFAEYNCFSCHQQLRAGTEELWTKLPPERPSGSPEWGGWNTVPLDQLPAHQSDNPLYNLRGVMLGFASVKATDAARAAKSARDTLQANHQLPALLNLRSTLEGVHPLQASAKNRPSWELLAHRYLLLASASRSLHDHGRPPQLAGSQFASAPLAAGVDPPLTETEARLSAIRRGLGFVRSDSEWPAVYAAASAGSSPPPGNAVQQSAREVAENLNSILEALKVAADRKD